MKIEVGKEYAMANGQVATIMEYRPGAAFPFMGSFGTGENGGAMSWNAEGEQCNAAADYRLVAEHVPPLAIFKLELGKRYVTRGGYITEPLTAGIRKTGNLTDDAFHEFGAIIQGLEREGRLEWRSDGRFYAFGECSCDLVSEYVEPEVVDAEFDQDQSIQTASAKLTGFAEHVAATVDPTASLDRYVGITFREIGVPTATQKPDWEVIADIERIMADNEYRPGVAAWFSARYGA